MRNVLTLCCILILSTCGNESLPNASDLPMFEADGISISNNTLLLDSSIRGNFGDMSEINGYAIRLSGFSNSDMAKVFTVVEHNTEYAMTVINVRRGGLNHEHLSIGTHYIYQYLTETHNTGFKVIVWGCLLHTEYESPYYDSPADETEVWVEQLGNFNYKRINYVARWFNNDSGIEFQINGYIDVAIDY